MIILDSNTIADLTDLAKSVQICQHLNIDFSIGEDSDGEIIAVHPQGVIGGLQIAFEIIELQWPAITTRDVAEFAEINGIALP